MLNLEKKMLLDMREMFHYETDVVELTKKLISTPSLSGQEGGVAQMLKDFLSTSGVDKAFIDKYGNVIGVIKGGITGSLVFEGHTDHVPPGDPRNWTYRPYDAKVLDDNLYGRGSVDMKGALASMIMSIELIGSKKDIPDIYYVFVPYEEIAEGVLFKKAIEDTLKIKPDLVILGEATNLNIHIGQRGRAVIQAIFKGKSSHASMPEKGINALVAAAHFINLIKMQARRMPKHRKLGKSTLTPTIIESSPKSPPMIPDECKLILDYRFVVGETRRTILEMISELGKRIVEKKEARNFEAHIVRETAQMWTGVKIEIEHYFPAWMNQNQELIDKILKTIRKRANPQAKLGVWKFSTDGVYSGGEAEIPTIGYGPGDESLAHQPNEHVPVKHLQKAVEGYVDIALNAAEIIGKD